MKTQKTTVTYESGTVTVAGKARITVHTGMVRVTCTKRRFRPVRLDIRVAGPFYTTATLELPDGRMEAITDPRASASPFAAGWR